MLTLKEIEATWPDHDIAHLCADVFDGHDPWGSSIGIAFEIAAALVSVGEWLPDEWQASNIHEATEEDYVGWELADWMRKGLVSPSEVREFGTYLLWLSDQYKAHGCSY